MPRELFSISHCIVLEMRNRPVKKGQRERSNFTIKCELRSHISVTVSICINDWEGERK